MKECGTVLIIVAILLAIITSVIVVFEKDGLIYGWLYTLLIMFISGVIIKNR